MENIREKNVFLNSSGDEGNEDCLPKILNTISLQGCSTISFKNEDEDMDELLYPTCEIKEEKIEDESTRSKENGNANGPIGKKKQRKTDLKAKKRIKLTQLSPVKQRLEPKPVDASKLALQENLFKTKELFDTFLRVCQDRESSEQMEKVVEKLTRSYEKTRQEFLGSLHFQNILESETEKVNTSSNRPWLNFKLVMDEMKHNKKLTTPKLKLGESEESQDAGGSEDEPIIECPKKRRHLKKLEKTLRALNRKIKALEEREVDLSDDDSAYVKLDRYRARFTEIYNKICEIKGKLADADRPYLRKVSFAGTTYPHINRCIERYYNKHREFPDFQDIKKLVTVANQQEGIEMPPIKIHSMAAAAFKEFGEMLKRLRQYDDYDVIISYLDQQVDPARDSPELLEELNKNALLFKKKEQEVIDRFASETAGLEPNSDEDSEKPKKKKKILISNSKKNSSSSSKKLVISSDSSSESSDEEKNNVKHVKKKESGPGLSGAGLSSSSDRSDSENETKKKKTSATGKGKALVGKPRIVKRSRPQQKSPKKPSTLRTTISSDDDNTKDPKDTFTNYLGLHVKNGNKETNTLRSDEDEITCVKEIVKKYVKKSKSSSDSDSTGKANHHTAIEVDEQSNNSDSGDEKLSKHSLEPTAVVNSIVKSISKGTDYKTNHLSREICRKKSVDSNRISVSSESDNHRTSDEESDESVKKPISDVELSNSSDEDDKKEEIKESDTIVILSEEIPEKAPAPRKNCPDSGSDSDDICILSPSSNETRTVAPRRANPEKSVISIDQNKAVNRSRPMSTVGAPRKTLSNTTSTPMKPATMNLSKRKMSSHSSNVSVTKKPRRKHSTSSSDSVRSGGSGKQLTPPCVINGAGRKTIFGRLPQCKPTGNSGAIPLIEID